MLVLSARRGQVLSLANFTAGIGCVVYYLSLFSSLLPFLLPPSPGDGMKRKMCHTPTFSSGTEGDLRSDIAGLRFLEEYSPLSSPGIATRHLATIISADPHSSYCHGLRPMG